jgi:signal transduction histidine kinase
MMPTVLFQKGLLAALEEMVSRINEAQLRISLSVDDYNPNTDKTTELVLYRIIQECVNNTVRHAQATALFISIHPEEGQLAVLLEDDGVGMAHSPAAGGGGLGMQNIKSRVQYLRGSVEWHPVNPDNSGTIIEIYIPLSV